MRKDIINFTGINRNDDDGISKDGACMELVNCRVNSNGSLIPVGMPILENTYIGVPVYIHRNAGYEHTIIKNYSEDDGFTLSWLKDGVMTTILTSDTFNSIQSVGNTLMVISDTKIEYCLFNDGQYKYLGDNPPLPSVNVKAQKADDEVRYSASTSKLYDITDEDELETFKNDALGLILKAGNEATEDGKCFKFYFYRYALRLFDGTYIKHSPVYLTRSTNKAILSTSTCDKTESKISASVWGYVPGISIYDSKNITNWSDIVDSVDLFMYEYNPYSTDNLVDGDFTDDPDDYILQLVTNRIVKSFTTAFSDVEGFYLASSLKVKSIVPGKSFDLELSTSKLDNLVFKEKLSIDSLTHHSTVGNVNFVYNSRLHIADITTRLFEGFQLKDQCLHKGLYFEQLVDDPLVISEMSVKVNINTNEGICEVTTNNFTSFSCLGISPIFMYPDARAFSATIKVKAGSSEATATYKEITITLKEHPYLNIAYYQTDDLLPLSITLGGSGIDESAEVNNVERTPNKLKVSSVNNPFSFPVAQTYTVSNGTIVQMCAATTALSEGQYGQFPLYVFTNEGIYSLSVGTGTVAYATSNPVTRDVSKGLITSIDNAVVFATETEIKVLQGSQSLAISDNIKGFLPSSMGVNGASTKTIIEKIMDIPSLPPSTVDFNTYLDDISIGYVYNEKEIIVANKNFSYSYVYSMKSNQWYKIDVQIDSFLNSYPKCLAVCGQSTYNMFNPNCTVNKIAIITKPIKLGSTSHKRIIQSAFRGRVLPSNSTLYFRGESLTLDGNELMLFSSTGFYVLGSNDAENFVLVSGREKISDVRDLVTKMSKSKAYKYFILALVGGVRTDVALNFVELIIDDTYTSRLH